MAPKEFTTRDEDFGRAIRQRHIDAILNLVIADSEGAISVRDGFKTETELWDYKRDCPEPRKKDLNPWINLAKHVLAFHNNKGGVIFFGIEDKKYKFIGANPILDSKLFNDQTRRYLSDSIWVEYHRSFIQADQRYLGVALVPPRGPAMQKFTADGIDGDGEVIFEKGGAAIREGDSSRILTRVEVEAYERNQRVLPAGQIYAVDEPNFRILQPEYISFAERIKPCSAVDGALSDPRTAVVAITGIGGAGKTALATWAVLKAYREGRFDLIVSITAKDRELTASGIKALQPMLSGLESLLDAILDVSQYADYKSLALDKKETHVREILGLGRTLLFVDNLETVEDARIVEFLDSLPVGVRAIVTSRRAAVRVSVRPIELGSLTEDETQEFIALLRTQAGFGYVADLSPAEIQEIGKSCDRIPLAIKWTLGRSVSAPEAVALAKSVAGPGRKGEELLEFCFRRVFEGMTEIEKNILHVLSLFQRPMPLEVVLVAAASSRLKIVDALEEMVTDSIIQRFFDADRSEYCFSLVPIARVFVYREVSKKPKFEENIRKVLASFFEALDVKDVKERLVVREIRQGKEASESALLDLAIAAHRRNELDAAETLYVKALSANPISWRTARNYAKYLVKSRGRLSEGLAMYERAANYAPAAGLERANIFREWGLALKDSGDPAATNTAIDKFRISLAETPNDVMLIFLLAEMYERSGAFGLIVTLIAPLAAHKGQETKTKALQFLLKAHEHLGDILQIAEIKQRLASLNN